MTAFSICLSFRSGRGHCYVTVLNSSIPIDKFEKTSCHEYNADSGEYDILCQGVSPAGGTTIDVQQDGVSIGKRTISDEGYFTRRIRIKL